MYSRDGVVNVEVLPPWRGCVRTLRDVRSMSLTCEIGQLIVRSLGGRL